MDFHKRFGANLRNECYRYNSIAEVCRGIGINRQQFNKYLSGNAIPNPATLTRICNYFKINSVDLFRAVDDAPDAAPLGNRPSFDRLLRHLRNSTEPSLPLGLYHVYYSMPFAAGLLMRALLVVKNDDSGGKKFTRLTVFPREGHVSRYLLKSRHEGVVCTNGRQIYLVGVADEAPHVMSMLALEADSGSPQGIFRCGLSLVRTTSEFISTAVCVERLAASVSLKAGMRALGPVFVDDRSVDRFVAMAVGGQTSGHTLRSVEYHSILTQSLQRARPEQLAECGLR